MSKSPRAAQAITILHFFIQEESADFSLSGGVHAVTQLLRNANKFAFRKQLFCTSVLPETKRHCYGLNACVPLDAYVEALPAPNVKVFGGGLLGGN